MPISFSVNRVTHLQTDNDNDGFADAGDILRHILTLTNTGTTDATGVVVNDTLVGSTETGLMNISPIAFDDSFTAFGNTLLEVGNATTQTGPQSSFNGNILSNDAGALPGDDFTGFSISALQATAVVGVGPVTALSANGGTVTLITSGVDAGSFTYVSAAGFTGTDTFTYTIKDVGIDGIAGNADDTSSTATVTITVANKIWYVDSSAGTTGDGTSTNPFDSLDDVTGATGPDAAGDIIYLNTGTYDHGVTLLNNQTLVGEGSALVVAATTLAAAGTDATITNSGATNGSNGVVLGSGNTLTGFTVGNTGGYDIANTTASTVGTLTISNVDLTGTGGLFRADSGGALNVTLDTATTTGTNSGINGIQLGGALTGSFNAVSGAISGVNATGATDVLINGGTETVSVGSSITSSAGGSIDIGSHNGNVTLSGALNISGGTGISVHNNTGGTIAFSGAKVVNTGANNAVDLDTNTGATINFTGGGLDLDTTTGTAFEATGGGTISVTGSGNSATTTTGTAINLANMAIGAAAGANGVTFDAATSNGAANGILISTVSQASGSTGIDILSGSIANVTSRGVDIDSTSADVTVNSTISTAASATVRSVEVTNSGATGSGSTINFGGSIDDNGGGINLDNNDANSGATINFTGGLDIDTATSTGFNAVNGGRVNVTGGSNSINSTSATALNVANTTIGTSGLTFHDISSGNNTAAGEPVNGIVLTTTGTSGGLTVTGDGGGSNNGSGGTIQHTTGDGILLTSTQDVHLGYMNLTSNLGDGIGGSNVNGFVLNRMNVTLNGDDPATDESGVNLDELTGTASAGAHPTSISNSVFTNNEEFQVQITNTSGTLTNFQFTNNTVTSDGSSGTIGNLVNFMALGSANMAITATGGTYTGAAPNTATGLNIDHSGTSGLMSATVNGGTFTNNNVAVTVSAAQGGSIDFDINGTTSTGNRSHGLNLFVAASSTGTVTGTFLNNIIGTTGVLNSGSSLGFGIRVQNEALATANPVTVLISGNTIRELQDFAAININQGIAGQTSSRTTNATIINNVISDVHNSRAIIVQQNNSTDADSAGITNVDIHGNSFSNIAGLVGDGTVMRIRQLDANGGDLNIVQTAPTAANTATELDNANGVTNPALISVSGSVDYGQAAPPLPLLLVGDDGNLYVWEHDPRNSPNPAPVLLDDPNGSNSGGGDTGGGTVVPPPADPGPIVVDDGILSQAELTLIVNAAIERWAAAGVSAEELAAMRAVTITVEDLAGRRIGSSEAGHIILDSDAAGARWFIDATPDDDSEFVSDGVELHGISPGAAAHVDLLTVVMHELGHQIGLADSYAPGDDGQLMDGTISAGERRLPGNDEVAQATGTASTGDLSLTPVSLGTVPHGRTVTIQWDSTVDAFVNQLVPTYNNHSNVTWIGGPGAGTDSNTETLSGTSPLLALDSLTLSGTIWNDNGAGGGTANNGIKDGTETGINSVTLSLFVDADNDNVADTPGTSIATTSTAGGGNYSFTNIAPGNYIVRVDAGNFTGGGALLNKVTSTGGNDPDDDVNNDDNGVAGPGGSIVSNAITLAQGTETVADGTGQFDINDTLDFGFIQLNASPSFAALNGTPTFTEGGAAVVLDNNATVSDPDLTGTNYAGATLTLARSAGAVASDLFGGNGGPGLTLSGGNASVNGTTIGTFTQTAGTLTITFNASATQTLVNGALQGITYSNSSDNPPASAVIAYAFNDGNAGAQGAGGALTANGSVTVSITPVNDAPTATLSVHSLGPATEQTAFDLKNAGLSVGDVDGNSGSETVTLAVGQGVLNVTAGTSGAAVSGSGTNSVTITGTIAQINALLSTDGTSTVSFINGSDAPPASSSLTLTIHDNGATGGGDLSASDSGTISISAVNDVPVFSGLDGTPNFTEGGAPAVLDGNATATDPELTGTNYAGATLTLERSGGAVAEDLFGTSGTLSFGAGPGFDVNVGATTIGSYTQSGGTLTISFNVNATQSLVNTMLQDLTYSNSSDSPPASAVIAYSFNDGNSGSQGSGGPLTANGSVTVSITPVNDTPVVTFATTLSVIEQVSAVIDAAAAIHDVDLDARNGGAGDYGGAVLSIARQGGANADDGFNFVPSGAFTILGNTLVTPGFQAFATFTNTGGTLTISFTDSGTIATTALVNAVVQAIAYKNNNDTPSASIDLVVSLDDGAPGNASQGTVAGHPAVGNATVHVDIAASNDPPVLDLNGIQSGTSTSLLYTENDPATAIAPVATVTDVDTTDFNGGHLSVNLVNGVAEDLLSILDQGSGAGQIGYASGTISYEGTAIADLLPGSNHDFLDIAFRNVTISAAAVQALVRAIAYSDSSDQPNTQTRLVTFTIDDGDGTANSGVSSTSINATISITPVDDPAVAVNDPGNVTNENATVNIAVLGNDSDVDGPAPSVAKVDGVSISVGSPVTLASGAIVSLNLDGSLTYDPNGQFDTLTSPASGEIGAVNTSAPDSFTYTLAGTGGGTATVSVTVNGVVSAQDHLEGDGSDNIITGTPTGDFFDLSQGGNDQALGLGSNDGFFFGAAFTADDQVDGGGGSNDQIGLQGDYTGANALVLGASTIVNVEAIVVLPGFSYDIKTADTNVAAGALLSVQATRLAIGQNLHFDGSAETDGRFMIYGGLGDDNLTGGAGNDGFYFGPGQFNSSDIVNGGAGSNDQLGLDGDYSITLGGNLTGIEAVVLLHGPAATPNHFNITAANSLVAAGQTMIIFGLQVETAITFNGTAELDGAFKIYGGTNTDTLTGGHGNDWIFGGNGADGLTGGAGNDIFYYDNVAQSTVADGDTILDFAAGDRIDVSGIDAIVGGGNDAFSYLGSGAFTNTAGELRAVDQGGSTWLVQGDTNGDSTADFQLTLTVSDGHPITSADFTL